MTGMALGTLIKETRKANGWSLRAVEEYARAQNVRLDKSALSEWENDGMETVVPERVHALATALRIPTYRVALAVLADMGIVIPLDARSPEEAIEHDHTLPRELRLELVNMIRAERSRHGK